jgi:hypothetical protein
MDWLPVCAARFLASAALCRYSSDRDDMQGEHWKDASVPEISPNQAASAALVSWSWRAQQDCVVASLGPSRSHARRVGALKPCLICAVGYSGRLGRLSSLLIP